MGIEERRKREKDERRDSILRAAIEVYKEDGYHAATMEKIAEKAELSRATLYLYFKTKDEIFVNAIVSHSDYFGDLLEGLYGERERIKSNLLKELWRRFQKFYKRDPVAFSATVYFHQGEMLRRLPDNLRTLFDRSGARNYELLCRIMDYGIKKGYFSKYNAKTLAEFVWTSFLGIIHLEYSKEAMSGKTHHEETWNLAFQILEKGILEQGGTQ